MRHPSRFIKRVSLTTLVTVALCCSMLCLSSLTTAAQSGRRTSQRTQTRTAPVPETQPTPPTPVVKSDKTEVALYVGHNEGDLFLNIPNYLRDSVMEVFLQRIKEASSIKVTPGKEMQRTEAIKRAKNEQSTYVVLLQLDLDTFDSNRTGSTYVDPNKLFVRYLVFAPVTGKIETEGRVFQQALRVGRGGIGLPTPTRNNPLYSDYLLKQAAREAANRVLASLRAYQPPRQPGTNGK